MTRSLIVLPKSMFSCSMVMSKEATAIAEVEGPWALGTSSQTIGLPHIFGIGRDRKTPRRRKSAQRGEGKVNDRFLAVRCNECVDLSRNTTRRPRSDMPNSHPRASNDGRQQSRFYIIQCPMRSHLSRTMKSPKMARQPHTVYSPSRLSA